jgi:hypothetical protein
MCDIWINILLQTNALVGPLHIVTKIEFKELTGIKYIQVSQLLKVADYVRIVEK